MRYTCAQIKNDPVAQQYASADNKAACEAPRIVHHVTPRAHPAQNSTLPFTGADLFLLVIVASIIVAVGLALRKLGRTQG